MRRFANLVLTFPQLQQAEKSIRIVTNSKNLPLAKNLRKNLEQLGFPIDHTNAIVQTGAVITNSEIHSYFNKTGSGGFDEKHILIQSLKQIEDSIPVTFDANQKFATGTGKYIEIILGQDAKNYFKLDNSSSASQTNNTRNSPSQNTAIDLEPIPSPKTKTQQENPVSLPSQNEETNTPTLPSEQSENH